MKTRWPDGPTIGIGVADDALCFTHETATGVIVCETFFGLFGRLDVTTLRARLVDLQPSAALLMSAPVQALEYEHGVIFGCAIGVLAALGIATVWWPLPRTVQAPAGMVLH